jgi:hypothetical protein
LRKALPVKLHITLPFVVPQLRLTFYPTIEGPVEFSGNLPTLSREISDVQLRQATKVLTCPFQRINISCPLRENFTRSRGQRRQWS